MSENFVGCWRVSEYVFDANGSFVGVIEQRRQLMSLPNGRIRVTQHCTPKLSDAKHAMNAFAGEWIFEMSRHGRKRLYHGPDVVGLGLNWGEETITGRGVWTRFGHNFTSFGVMVNPRRQITGGKFYNASELVANIVGVAIVEDEKDHTFPKLDVTRQAHNFGSNWKGERRVFDTDGHLRNVSSVCDEIGEFGWKSGNNEIHFAQDEDRLRVSGAVRGIAKRFGCAIEMFAVDVDSPNAQIESFAVLDSESQTWIEVAQKNSDGKLASMEVTMLKMIETQ
jgi:hypothetical protein